MKRYGTGYLIFAVVYHSYTARLTKSRAAPSLAEFDSVTFAITKGAGKGIGFIGFFACVGNGGGKSDHGVDIVFVDNVFHENSSFPVCNENRRGDVSKMR